MVLNKSKPVKTYLHPRNRNRVPYNLEAMVEVQTELTPFIQPNKVGKKSINFSDPKAVKALNKAILHFYYGIEYWDFPEENLCPPIPGRAEYIHLIADLLAESNGGKIPKGEKIHCLDIGVGATCIYPIIGVTEYDWNFIGSDMDPKSIASSKKIILSNSSLKGKVICSLQNNSKWILRGIIGKEEKIDITICNPPFHASAEDALKGSRRKIKNLTGKKVKTPNLNFSGNTQELIYEGGEFQFITNLIYESKAFSKNCLWFTSLVSKESNLKAFYKLLHQQQVSEIKTIDIKTGNKISRVLAWTFLETEERALWRKERWN